jgi:hypothetical protein
MILILSNKWDISVDFVVYELKKRDRQFLRINTEDLFSEIASIFLPDFKIFISKQQQIKELIGSINVIWNRRPGRVFDSILNEKKPSLATQEYVNNQWYTWLEALQLIPDITWINHPQKNDSMENKIQQLLLADKIGFSIPDTLISNNPKEVKNFIESNGGSVVAKALFSPLIEEPEMDYFIFTNQISLDTLGVDEEIEICPTIYQQNLSPKKDYRVTVIGEEVISAKIEDDISNVQNIDWRESKSGLSFVQCKLPKDIEENCRKIVQSGGLLFGSIDLVEYKGDYYFLEINPNGEWGWLEKPNNIPIAEKITELLIHFDE